MGALSVIPHSVKGFIVNGTHVPGALTPTQARDLYQQAWGPIPRNLQTERQNAQTFVRRAAENYRARLFDIMPGKLEENRIKEKVAGRAVLGDQTALDLLSPEASVHGVSAQKFAEDFLLSIDETDELALQISAFEAQTLAALAAQNSVEGVDAVLSAAKAQADALLGAALAARVAP